MIRRWSRALAAAPFAFFLGGCIGPGASLLESSDSSPETRAATEEELRIRDALWNYADLFYAEIAQASERIRAKSADPEIRRRASFWRLEMAPYGNQLAADSNAEVGLMDLTFVAAQQAAYLREGGGREAFGDCQTLANAAAVDLEKTAWTMDASLLSADGLARLRKIVAEGLKNNPPVNAFDKSRVPDMALARGWLGGLKDEDGLFSGLENGIDTANNELRILRLQVESLGNLARQMPSYGRWSAEIFEEDLLSRPEATQSLDDLHHLRLAADRLTATVDRLEQKGVLEKFREESLDAGGARLKHILWLAFGLLCAAMVLGFFLALAYRRLGKTGKEKLP